MNPFRTKAVMALMTMAISATGFSQTTRAFNQNASRSNHSRLSLTVSPVFSSPVKGGSNDTLLFRSSGAGLQMGIDYKLGKVGIGVISGFTSSGNNTAAINQFLKETGLGGGQTTISKSRQQQTYLLLGPSASIGKEIQLEGHFKAGLFLNNSGNTSIRRGFQDILYQSESTEKNAAFGFITGLKLRYNLGASPWSLALGADYLQTQTQVNNYDVRYGQQSVVLQQPIKDLLGHLSISYTLPSRQHKNNTIASTPFTNTDLSSSNTANCGTVLQRTTLADGSIQELNFACPQDAAAYNSLAKNPETRPQLRAQNNNTVRSNRTELKSILIEVDTDNNGDYETDMSSTLFDDLVWEAEASARVQDHNNSRSNKSLQETKDKSGEKATEAPMLKAGVSTSRSNIRTRQSLQAISDDLYFSYGTAIVNDKEVNIKIYYKLKPDTAKNSIGNIR